MRAERRAPWGDDLPSAFPPYPFPSPKGLRTGAVFLTAAVIITAAALFLAGSTPAQVPFAPTELRVAVLTPAGATPGEPPPPAATWALVTPAGVRLAFTPCHPDPAAGKLALAGAAAVLLDDGAAPILSGWTDREVSALEASVRAGAGLVVVGQAAAALPGSERFTVLLGRGTAPDAGRFRHGLALEFPDQSHPATQCVTDLWFAHATPRAAGATGTEAIALAVPLAEGPRTAAAPGDPPPGRGLPVIWTRRLGGGRVAGIGLECTAPAGPEAAAAGLLITRALEWTAGRDIASRLPDALPLLAEKLGEHDSLPGLPARSGFYRGREIAPVMGYQAIDWLLRPDREETELPEKVLESLAIPPGSTVADLGAGAGYFTFRLARRVGAEGKVIAADVQEEMLVALKARMKKEGVRNIEPVLATETDPRLPEGAVDLVLMVDVYHELAQPRPVVERIAKSLRRKEPGGKGGRLVLVEYRGEDPAVPIKPLHRLTVAQARAELEPLGFRWVETKDFLPHQHILIFERAGE